MENEEQELAITTPINDNLDVSIEELAKKKHPKGLYLLFFTEMWERFSYYGMRGILIYYLAKTVLEGGLGFDAKIAPIIYGTFGGFVYFTPLIGGWIADRFLGQRKCITIGGITMMMAQLVLFAFNTQAGLIAGLFLLIIGNGFFKANISTIVGKLYTEKDPRRDSAFSIFYMGINIGALIAPLIIGLLTDNLFAKQTGIASAPIHYGYRYAFLASAIGMFIGQITFNLLARKYLGDLGLYPAGKEKDVSKKEQERLKAEAKLVKLTKVERQRIFVIFIFFFFSIFFWSAYEQAGSSLSLFTDSFIDRNINLPFFGHFLVPSAWFQSVNPFFIVVLAPLFAMLWQSKLGQKLSTPNKMGIGMVLLGVGFFFMLGAVAQRGGDNADIAVKASMYWIILTYLIQTIAELCLSPVGLSVVTKLAPLKLASLLMGIWLLGSCFGNFFAGYIASLVETFGAGKIYSYVSIFVICCGVVMLLFNKKIIKLMHGIK